MLKKFLIGAALFASFGTITSPPAEAEEMFVRNRVFREAYFVGGTAYAPADSFLKAVKVPWTVRGSTIVLGEGASPGLGDSSESITLSKDGKTLALNGSFRNGKLYVPVKPLAEFVGYKVKYNNKLGVVDVIKAQVMTEAQEKAFEEVAAARAAEKSARKAKWNERVEKARAERQAKADEKAAAEDDDSDEDFEDEDEDTDVVATDSDSGKSAKPSKASDDDEDLGDDDEDSDDPKAAKSTDKAADSDKDTEEAPPEAKVVVLSTDANPNLYDGNVQFLASLQNQGYAGAVNVSAKLVAIGPDGKVWVSKTLYHRGPLAPDGRWDIVEDYRHKLRGGMPRGTYKVTVTPSFKTAPENK